MDTWCALRDSARPQRGFGVQRRLQEEHERCQQYLGPTTRRPLISCVEEQLLTNHVAALLDKGFAGLMAPDRMPDLARLYRCSPGSHCEI